MTVFMMRRPEFALEFTQMAELFLDLSKETGGQRPEGAHEPAVVDGAVLIDHDLAVFSVSRDPSGKRHAEQVPSRKPGRARQDPSGRMSRQVQEVSLNHQNRQDLPGLRA